MRDVISPAFYKIVWAITRSLPRIPLDGAERIFGWKRVIIRLGDNTDKCVPVRVFYGKVARLFG